MEPTAILEKPRMLLVGFSFFGDPFQISGEWTEENEIGRLWHRFMRYMTHHGSKVKHLINPEAYYEVHVEHPETVEKGHFDVFVGQEVDQLADVPIEPLIRILPPTTYAVFTLHGQQIFADWMQEVWEWFQRSGYQRAYTYGFQLYDRRFKGLQNIEESAIDVYIPVKLSRQG